MNGTVYREGCGTFLALRLHQANGEPPCSRCLAAEDWRRDEHYRSLEREGLPRRPQPAGPLAPVTPEEGARNQALLAAALRDIDSKRRAS